jgi:CRP-like cAMP-binding protein
MTDSELNPLVRKLSRVFPLDESEQEALKTLRPRIVRFSADTEIIREGDLPTDCNLLLEGLVCRYNLIPEGKRQIISFHFPGDIFDSQSFLLQRMDHGISALTDCKVAAIPHVSLFKLFQAHPRVGMAMWKDSLIDAAIFRQWVTNVGRRDANARTAHLICETFVRLNEVGLAENGTIPWPITQAELADALGMSYVHVNRTLQELRRAGLSSMQRQRLTIHDWQGLTAAAGFDPTYLHRDEKHHLPL